MQLTYSAEIEAIRTDAGFSKPVVALESTIITHGMPYPQNLDVAREELMSKLVSNPKEKRHLDTLRTNLRKMSMTTLQTYIRSSDDAGAKTMFARYEKAFGAFDAAATVLRDALDVPAQFKKIRKSMMDAFSYIEPAVRMNVVQNLVASSGTERANQVIETILATYKGEMEEIVAWLPKRLQAYSGTYTRLAL